MVNKIDTFDRIFIQAWVGRSSGIRVLVTAAAWKGLSGVGGAPYFPSFQGGVQEGLAPEGHITDSSC